MLESKSMVHTRPNCAFSGPISTLLSFRPPKGASNKVLTCSWTVILHRAEGAAATKTNSMDRKGIRRKTGLTGLQMSWNGTSIELGSKKYNTFQIRLCPLSSWNVSTLRRRKSKRATWFCPTAKSQSSPHMWSRRSTWTLHWSLTVTMEFGAWIWSRNIWASRNWFSQSFLCSNRCSKRGATTMPTRGVSPLTHSYSWSSLSCRSAIRRRRFRKKIWEKFCSNSCASTPNLTSRNLLSLVAPLASLLTPPEPISTRTQTCMRINSSRVLWLMTRWMWRITWVNPRSNSTRSKRLWAWCTSMRLRAASARVTTETPLAARASPTTPTSCTSRRSAQTSTVSWGTPTQTTSCKLPPQRHPALEERAKVPWMKPPKTKRPRLTNQAQILTANAIRLEWPHP